MPISNPQRAAELRRVIDEFLASRLNDKLDKVKDDENVPEKSSAPRDELLQQFTFAVWIKDAARRVSQIQAVTHSLKPIHPDARGTSLYCPPGELPKHELLGSHCLGLDFEGDAAGNAAALDVYKFLKLPFEGRSLLALMFAGDHDLPTILSDDAEQATMTCRRY